MATSNLYMDINDEKDDQEIKEALLIDDNSKHIFYNTDFNNIKEPYIEIKGAYLVPALGTRTFDGHTFISGATGAGKSYLIRKMLDNDKRKRQCVLFTDYSKKDPAYDNSRIVRYDEKGTYNSGWLAKHQEHKIMIFDDMEFDDDMKFYRDKALKEGRKHDITVICVNHKLKDYKDTKTPLNDCRFIVSFPCTNRGSCFEYLKDDLRINGKKIDWMLDILCKGKRQMIIHKNHPNFVAGTRSIFKV